VLRTLFLLGSGISRDAEMPMANDITRQVVGGEGVWLHTSETFAIGAENPNYPLYRPPVEPVLALVNDLGAVARDYFRRDPTYEEIAQIARQLDDTLSGEYESAAAVPLIEQLLTRDYAGGDIDRLHELTRLVHRYIADTIRQMLSKPPTSLVHLDALVEATRRLGRVDLATLNHDLVLEAALTQGGLPYTDGFERGADDVRFWLDDWAGADVRLLKLHGSLDWWAYQIPSEAWRGWVVARCVGGDAIHPTRPGVEPYPQDLRPIILTGTFDKILSYETWIFPDQHLRFHERLREADRVIVIGYGFGDKAVNTRLIAWLARSREHHLVVCHGEPDDLRMRARGAIRNKWPSWLADGQLIVVPKWVADLVVDDLIDAAVG
jgi:hypothetical protein